MSSPATTQALRKPAPGASIDPSVTTASGTPNRFATVTSDTRRSLYSVHAIDGLTL